MLRLLTFLIGIMTGGASFRNDLDPRKSVSVADRFLHVDEEIQNRF